jgi:hypothetical protein
MTRTHTEIVQHLSLSHHHHHHHHHLLLLREHEQGLGLKTFSFKAQGNLDHWGHIDTLVWLTSVLSF